MFYGRQETMIDTEPRLITAFIGKNPDFRVFIQKIKEEESKRENDMLRAPTRRLRLYSFMEYWHTK